MRGFVRLSNGRFHYLMVNEKFIQVVNAYQKEGMNYYLSPDCKDAKEQVLFDFDSKVSDVTCILNCNSIDTFKFKLVYIRALKEDSLFSYKPLYSGNGCEDCDRIRFFTISTKAGFKRFYRHGMLPRGYYIRLEGRKEWIEEAR